MLKRRKAFTLIEMLVVIIIIGILSAMVFISLANSADKAKAVKIVNNMSTLKSALIVYYTNNEKWPEGLNGGSGNKNTAAASVLSPYLDNNVGDAYTIIRVSYDKKPHNIYNGSIFIKYDGTNDKLLTSGVKQQLAKMAKNANLWNSSAWVATDSSYQYYDGKHGTVNTIHMPVLIITQ